MITLHRRIGMWYERLGDYRRAIDEYSNVPLGRGTGPSYDERTFVPIRLSHCWRRLGEWERAATVLEQAAKRWAGYPLLVEKLRVHLELLRFQIPKSR